MTDSQRPKCPSCGNGVQDITAHCKWAHGHFVGWYLCSACTAEFGCEVLPKLTTVDPQLSEDLEHLAYSLVHDGVEPPRGFGGCSCEVCNALRIRMMEIRHSEADEYYNERYGNGPKNGKPV
jgi:hypothetical protein